MKLATAAAYCDMTPDQFLRHCPVPPVDQGWRGHRWKRGRLDAWIDDLPETAAAKLDADLSTPEARRAASLKRI